MCKIMAKLPALALSAICVLFSAGSSSAGTVHIKNCSHIKELQVATYNSNDVVALVAYKDACLRGREKMAILTCATPTCQIKFWSGCPGPLSWMADGGGVNGHYVYYNGTGWKLPAGILNEVIEGGSIAHD